MEKKVYVLKEIESGRYRCQNLFVSNEEYYKNIVNACIYEELDEAEYLKNSLNRAAGIEFVRVAPIKITVEDSNKRCSDAKKVIKVMRGFS